MNDWLSTALMLSVMVAILGPLLWSLHTSTKDIEQDEDGWFVLRPSLFEHLMGAIQIVFAVVWIVLSVVAAFMGTIPAEVVPVFFFAAMLVMGLLFLREFLFTYLAKIKFNENGFHYTAWWRRIDVYWNEVREIRMSTNGPQVVTPEGNVTLSNTRRGFFQFIEIARKNGVTVEDNHYLMRPKKISIFRK